jgi:hypothetical protein
MNDLRKLTRIILIGLGVYILLRYTLNLFLIIPYFLLEDSRFGTFGIVQILSYVFAIIYVGTIIYLIFYKADFFAERIIKPQEQEQCLVWYVPFAFRLVSVFAGILFLYWVVPSIISTVSGYMASAAGDNFVKASGYFSWDRVLGWIVLLAMGIYLLCGAPHFVRWQVKKTVEQCRKLENVKKRSDGD